MILKTVSGIASRCGLNASLRLAFAAAVIGVTWWAGFNLLGWALRAIDVDRPGPLVLAATTSLVYLLVSLFTMVAMSDPPNRWTMEKMTGYAPFMMWRVMISDGRMTAWKLLLWPFLVPAEALICLWLVIGWLVRLLDVDLSKR